jgi:methylated-DNA-[protein]-cysteine S-methyltransferase
MHNNKHPLHYNAIVSAPFGNIAIAVQGMQVSIEFLPQASDLSLTENKLANQVASQITNYLVNSRHDFNLPLIHKGSHFQQKVWNAISAIPRGETRTYSDIAAKIGSGPRAVANACGANHLPLVIPCHRVVAKKGLGGFMRGQSGGEQIKQWLLQHEGVDINLKPLKPKAPKAA